MVRLSTVITDAAAVGHATLAAGAGHMPAGHNGPWDDAVTPLRNTGHWAILFFDAYDRSGDERYLVAAETCVEYCCREEARPHGATFHHRVEPGKDGCNGLVGQGWTIETLAVADRYLDSKRPRRLAEEVFLLHPFDEEVGLWHSVDVDGTDLGPFGTINQQFWFAAAGSLLCRDGMAPEARRRIVSFLDDAAETVETYRSGVVYHSGYPYRRLEYPTQRVAARLTGHHEHVRARSIGYHSFVLYALGILRESLPGHPLWKTGFVDDLLDPLTDESYRTAVADNVYSFGYNVTGIELAYALEAFDHPTDPTPWLDEQFVRCYDSEQRLFSVGYDGETLAARLYQAGRLRDRDVPVETRGSATREGFETAPTNAD